jgi:hypothetical protein
MAQNASSANVGGYADRPRLAGVSTNEFTSGRTPSARKGYREAISALRRNRLRPSGGPCAAHCSVLPLGTLTKAGFALRAKSWGKKITYVLDRVVVLATLVPAKGMAILSFSVLISNSPAAILQY